MYYTVDDLSEAHFRLRRDGTLAKWHPEDETAVASKSEAVTMVQRTIDFWFPHLIDELQTNHRMDRMEAEQTAAHLFAVSMRDMLAKPWSRRWGMRLADFTFKDDPND